jgi:predicted nucleic acid-binding protein
MESVTLVDTSVWIEFLRGTGSAADIAVNQRQRSDPAGLAMTPPVAMELLFGPTDELAVRRIERLVNAVGSLDVDSGLDFAAAADIFRAVRRTGRSPRSGVDCLIAAIAIRHQVTLLHKDIDFEIIAEVTGMRHESLRD